MTVKVPDKQAETLAKAVAVSSGTFGFDSLAEAKHWFETEQPFMRAEFLFQPQGAADADWTFGASQGVALKLLGARIYNRCTGQVLHVEPAVDGQRRAPDRGQPRSRLPRGRARARRWCPRRISPLQLSKIAIGEAMSNIRAQVFACYQKFHVPGRLELTYVVANNGTVQSVVVGPAYAGTSTGLCVLEAAKDARFTPFRIEHQKFTYPFFLRD